MAYVETHCLTKRFGRLTALQCCQLSVQRGEVLGLLGPNGSGKTTLLRLLMGYLRASAGRATIDGLDCYRQSVAVHSRLAYLPGDVRLPARMRGRRVLELLSGLRSGADPGPALAHARQLGLDVNRPVAHLSTGMRQKLALAAVFAPGVPLLILDEPTNNLDPTARRQVLQLVAEARQAGRTVLFSSHVLSEVEQACDRVAILRGGQLASVQVMADLRRQHRLWLHVTGPVPQPPVDVGPCRLERPEDGLVTIETAANLSRVLRWLSGLPLAELRIEPVGLQSVYDRYHADELP